MSQQNNEQVVFLEAYATGLGMGGGGPSYAKIVVGNNFPAQLLRLQGLCERNELSEVRISYAPDMWGPEGVEEELRMESPELVVSKTSFWFTDRGRHSDGHVETRLESIKDFLRALAEADGPIYLGSNPATVEGFVLDDTPAPDEEGEPEAFR